MKGDTRSLDMIYLGFMGITQVSIIGVIKGRLGV